MSAAKQEDARVRIGTMRRLPTLRIPICRVAMRDDAAYVTMTVPELGALASALWRYALAARSGRR